MIRIAAIAAVGVAVAALAATAGVVLLGGSGDDRFAQCRESQVAGADIGGPFSLVSEDGARVTDAEVIDRPSLVYFGYSYCPDVCPIDLSRNAVAVDLLTEQGIDVKPVFITVDPERDTVQQMAEYTDFMHPEMVGLTGSVEEVEAAKRAYRAYSAKVGDDPENYLVDHSSFTYLMAPEEGFLDFFPSNTTAEDMARRTACYTELL
ncbi:SCO family protein [Pontivivens ytuae]|uniref:SCO family protein n=1 Tax=Pontivivens ytuae TaxID=2789856 RepID=A0A7S9LP41_9RHOB|nr:SCO family protein [Pontivivens ytuae]QPH52684.1 SCO family protein [Pontivivens ytuae]